MDLVTGNINMGRLFAYGCSFTQGMWEFDESSSGTDEYKGVGSSHQFEYNTKKNIVRPVFIDSDNDDIKDDDDLDDLLHGLGVERE